MKDKPVKKSKSQRHAPLGDQILAAEAPTIRHRIPKVVKSTAGDQFVDQKLSKQIMRQARAQQNDEELLEAEENLVGISSSMASASFDETRLTADGNSDDEIENDGDEIILSGKAEDGGAFYKNLALDPEDEEALKMFMSHDAPKRTTLADMIMSRIKDHETEIASQMSQEAPMPELDPKIIHVFRSIGKILSRYRAGKLPKAFKIIPTLRNWEEVLYITDPHSWTAAAMYQATRIFTSNLNQKMAQRFFNLVLFPRIRDDITEYKRLNFHLYMAAKKGAL